MPPTTAAPLSSDSRGAAAVDYALLLGLLAIVALGVVRGFGGVTDGKLLCQAQTITNLGGPGEGACAGDEPRALARTPRPPVDATAEPQQGASPAGAAVAALVCIGAVCAMPPQPEQQVARGGAPVNEAKVIAERGETFYRDHSTAPGSCGSCHPVAKDPGGSSKREWQDKVLGKMGVTRRQLEGYTRFTLDNQAIMKSIYDYYRSAFKQNPDLLWAGMAVLAGRTVWKGLTDNVEKRFWIPSAHTDHIAKDLEYELMRMNLQIFMDLAWMHEAYLDKGLPELEKRFEAGDVDKDTIEAWRKIDAGIRNKSPADVQEGNKMLLRREQEIILERGYQNISQIPGIKLGRTMGRLAESPVPGGRRFSDVVPGGNLANFDERWKWIETEMVPNWNKMSREDRLHYVEQPIMNELMPPLRLDGFGRKDDFKALMDSIRDAEKKKKDQQPAPK